MCLISADPTNGSVRQLYHIKTGKHFAKENEFSIYSKTLSLCTNES